MTYQPNIKYYPYYILISILTFGIFSASLQAVIVEPGIPSDADTREALGIFLSNATPNRKVFLMAMENPVCINEPHNNRFGRGLNFRSDQFFNKIYALKEQTSPLGHNVGWIKTNNLANGDPRNACVRAGTASFIIYVYADPYIQSPLPLGKIQCTYDGRRRRQDPEKPSEGRWRCELVGDCRNYTYATITPYPCKLLHQSTKSDDYMYMTCLKIEVGNSAALPLNREKLCPGLNSAPDVGRQGDVPSPQPKP